MIKRHQEVRTERGEEASCDRPFGHKRYDFYLALTRKALGLIYPYKVTLPESLEKELREGDPNSRFLECLARTRVLLAIAYKGLDPAEKQNCLYRVVCYSGADSLLTILSSLLFISNLLCFGLRELTFPHFPIRAFDGPRCALRKGSYNLCTNQ